MAEDLVQVSRAELEYLRQIKERAEELLAEETYATQAGSLGNRNYNLHHYAMITLHQLLAVVPKNP